MSISNSHDILISPSSRLFPIVERSRVFIYFILEKERSVVVLLTGNVTAILRAIYRLGKTDFRFTLQNKENNFIILAALCGCSSSSCITSLSLSESLELLFID